MILSLKICENFISAEAAISPEEFRELLVNSTLSERKPADGLEYIKKICDNADSIVRAWMKNLLGL
jgi:hypothetical protein